ncbi:MAG: deoxyribose-phosphate aldolase [Tatlockia sp.]|jgi:deoxyribose-phosphate aldolase
MNLEESYLYAFHALKETSNEWPFSNSQAIALIDLTLLDEHASEEALLALATQANQHQVAAVCVLPQHTPKLVLTGDVHLATVVNFPTGSETPFEVLAALEAILEQDKVSEIDYVFPYRAYLEGETESALLQCQSVLALCHQAGRCFKVILETGALPSLSFIYELSRKLVDMGCDFIKTSTGKIAQGATPASAFAMLKAIKDSQSSCGIKISGGVRTPEQAFLYMQLAQHLLDKPLDKSWFRLGASSLLGRLS